MFRCQTFPFSLPSTVSDHDCRRNSSPTATLKSTYHIAIVRESCTERDIVRTSFNMRMRTVATRVQTILAQSFEVEATLVGSSQAIAPIGSMIS